MGAPLGPFWLSRRLAGGRTGEVWSGVHRRQGVQVAVKFLTVGRSAAVRAVFEHEIEIMATLDHPNIVRIWDHGLVPEAAAEALGGKVKAGAPYLVMEQGRATLGDRRQPLSWAGVRTVAVDLLGALGHAHAQGLLHRDLKPDNVLLIPAAREGERHRVVLTDFGFSGATGEEAMVVGFTPAFAAPEQLAFSARDEGPWTDLFALGCVIVALYTGRSPYDTTNVDEAKALQAKPLPRLKGLPEPIEAWVRSLLQLDPFARPASAAEALEGLIRAEGGTPPELPADWRRPEARVDRPPHLAGAGLGLVGIRSGSVGREIVRDELWGSFRRAAEGKTTAVVLRGVEGIGKTHLTRWLAQTAHELIGATELVVEGGDGDDGLIVALRRRLGLEGLGWWDGRQRIGAWLARTGGAAWLESRSVQKVLEPGVLPAESFGAIADLLRRAAHHRPLVVRIEDAQRLPDHLALVSTVLSERRDLPVLFLLTVRDEAVRSQPGLQEALQSLTWAGGRDRLLGELRGVDNDRFVAEHLGLAPDLRGAVARCSSGNPGVARGLLRRYASEGGLEIDEDGHWRRVGGGDVELEDDELDPARERVEAFLRARNDADRDTLELAATLGRDVATTELDAALRAAEVFRGPRLTSELVNVGLWQLSEAGWSFVDGRTVEVLRRQAVRAGRARRWNEVAAKVLEGDTRPWSRVRRARFLSRAWRAEDAVDPWVAGLRDLLDERPPADSADEIAALARCMSEADRSDPSVDELLVELWRWAGETERARRVAKVLRALEGTHTDAAALGASVLAELALDALEVDEAAQLATSAVHAAAGVQQRVSSRIVLARTHLIVGRIGACTELLEQARSMGRNAGRPEGEALLAQAELAAAEGRIAEASAWVDRAEGLARPTFRTLMRAVVAIAAGDLGQAANVARTARDTWHAAGQPELVRRAEVVLGSALLATGEADDALGCFRRAGASPSVSLRATAQAGKVAVAAVRGDRKSVDERLGALSRMPRLSGVVLPAMADLLALSAHALRPVHPDRAQAVAGLAAQGLNPLGRSDEATGDRRPRLVRKA